MKRGAPLAALLLAAAPADAAGEAARTEPVVVTAAPSALPLPQANRPVVVIGREEIARAPVSSVAELLAYVAGVEVRTRGPAGVQADVAIRGATVEQTDARREDLELTGRLSGAGELMGVRVLDHVIIGSGCYVSLPDRGLLG